MTETRAEKAQRLVDEVAVSIVMRWYHAIEAEVWEGQDLYCTMIYDNGLYSCDCGWMQYHAAPTDLCAHALAVKLAVEREKAR